MLCSTLLVSASVFGALRIDHSRCPTGLVLMQNATASSCSNATDELSLHYIAQAAGSKYSLVPLASSCPAGSRLAKVADVAGATSQACSIMEKWDITHLKDGTMSGSGYNCKVMKGDTRLTKNQLCMTSKPQPTPIKFFRVAGSSCPASMTMATSAQCKAGACCAILQKWDIVALADGTISGPGYDCTVRQGDPRAPNLGIRVCARQYSAAFEKYIQDFNKVYTSDDEKSERYAVFLESQARIARLNALNDPVPVHPADQSSAPAEPVFGLTFTSDRFQHEKTRRGRKGYGRAATAKDMAPVLEAAITDTPKSVDWRNTRAVTPVKNQGQCGSCWAFSTAETVESAHYLSKVGADVPILFSPQQIASCVTTMDGCGGGDTAVAFKYLEGEKYGLAPASFWEYAQGLTPTNTCGAKSCTQKCKSHNLKTTVTDAFYIGPSAHVNSFSYATPPCTGTCGSQDLSKLAKNLAAKGPVSICVNAGAWDDYTGGVMTSKACGGYGYDDLDHCVQLVGFNTTAPKPYWIVRNSWATSWGEEGYVYLEYSKNTCGLANEAIIPTIAASDSAAVEARMQRMRKLAWSA